ncbi:MAG: alpha/beta fold hydrolase [Verrucomicrobiota bacterium]
MRHLVILLLPGLAAAASWTETGEAVKGYPEAVKEIRYGVSADRTEQPALYYSSGSDQKKPLLVALHTWSGGYRQTMNVPAARWCVDKDWVFVHPDFRGPNRTPDSLGSDKAVSDVMDLVKRVQEKDAIDPDRIYLVGVSGGGHMALLLAGRHPEVWAGVSAWCGISDIAAWHEQCENSRYKKYAAMIRSACGGPPGASGERDRDYAHRSPLRWLDRAKDVNLDVQVGIWDGHKGSVPISHSLLAYNRVVPEAERLETSRIVKMTREPKLFELDSSIHLPAYGEKQPIYQRSHHKTRLTVFNGGHEIIYPVALTWLEKQHR